MARALREARVMFRSSYIRKLLFTVVVGSAMPLGLARPILAADPPVKHASPSTDDNLRPYRSPFEEALVAMEGGHFDVACPTLLRIAQTDRSPEHVFQMAQCHDQWGKVATAFVAYGDFLSMVDQLEGDAQENELMREDVALARYVALEKRVPWVSLNLPMNAPTNTRVTRRSLDGGQAERVPLEKAQPIDPGEYVVQTRVPTGRPFLNKLVMREGQRRSVVLEVDLAANGDAILAEPITPEPPKIPPLDPPMSARRKAMVGLGIGGAAALVAGVTTGVLAFAQNGTIATGCKPKATGTDLTCDTRAQEAVDLQKTLVKISGVVLPLGLIAVGTGITLYLTEPTPPRFSQTAWRLDVGGFPGNARVEVRASW
jgi:hypothetical protein